MLTEYQASCEERHAAFPAMVACLKSEVAMDSRVGGRDHDLLKLYLTYADALAERVQP